MDDKVAKLLTKALQENTRALEDHAKLLQVLTGSSNAPTAPQPRPQEPRIASADPLTRFLGDSPGQR